MRSCSDEILLERRDQHQKGLNSGGCPWKPRAPEVSGGGTHCSNSVHWGGASHGVDCVSPGSSVLGEDVPSRSAGAGAGPRERFEQRSVVSEFGSASWPFGSRGTRKRGTCEGDWRWACGRRGRPIGVGAVRRKTRWNGFRRQRGWWRWSCGDAMSAIGKFRRLRRRSGGGRRGVC